MRITAFLVLWVNVIFGQNILQGKVLSSDNNEALIGATVFSSIDTVTTDLNGVFQINLSIKGDLIVVQYLGYEEKRLQLSPPYESLEIELSTSNNILETAVISASMIEQRISESTVSLEVLKPDLIENTNGQSLDETLNLLPGVEIIDGQASIRGGSGYSYGAGSRVLLLIDNIPALQPDAGFPSWNDIALENIAQVEVVKGAASALYGSSALNGVINVRYAMPGSEPETSFSMNATSYGDPKDLRSKWWETPRFAYGAHLLHKQKIGKLDVAASLQYFQLESFRAETFQKRGRILLNTRYRLNARTTFGINTVGNISDNASFIFWQNAVRGAYLPFDGTEVQSLNNRWIIDPHFTHFDQYGNKHRVQGRIYYIDNGTANGLDNFSLLTYGEYQFQRKMENGLTLTSGIAGTRTQIEAGLYGGASYLSANGGLYLQLDKRFNDRLSASFGGRYEYNRLDNSGIFIQDGDFVERVQADQVNEGKPVFRFGLNYQIAKASFLRASIGQGYRFPTIAEKFTTVGLASFRIFTNADLRSETGWSSEIGLKQGLKLGDFYAFFDFAAFWSEYQNMMEFLLTGKSGVFGFQSSNIGDTRIRGIDTNISGIIGKEKFPINILLGYTFLDPRYIDFTERAASSSSVDFNILKYRSQHSAKLDLQVNGYGFAVGGNLRWVSHMVAIDQEFNLFIPGLQNFREVNDDGYLLLNLRASYKYKAYKLSFLVGNVTNANYTVRPALLEAPRNYTLRTDFNF